MRILYERIIDGQKRYIKAAGKSTETPPTANIATGSQYAQVDAGIIQMFEETDGEWHNFAKFDTGATSGGSLGATLGGGLGGGLGGSNPGTEEPAEGDS